MEFAMIETSWLSLLPPIIAIALALLAGALAALNRVDIKRFSKR